MTKITPAREAFMGESTSSAGPDRKNPYELLKVAILEGELAPGQPLVETALASKLQVSRTPVREALNRLDQDGLVIRADRGLLVRERSPEEILDIYEARIELEAAVSRSAAERRTEYDLRRLRRLVDRAHDVGDGDLERVNFNRQFHRAIWRASHNEAFADLLERLDLHLTRYPATTLSHPGRWESALEEHAALADAVGRRDVEGAGELARVHFTEARDIRIRLWYDAVE